MSLTKEIVIDQITIDENCNVMVREATRIMEDGVQLSQSFYRYAYSPGSDLEGADERVVAVCRAVWTPEVIEERRNLLAQPSEIDTLKAA